MINNFNQAINKGRGVWVPGLRPLRRLARDDTAYLSHRSVHRGFENIWLIERITPINHIDIAFSYRHRPRLTPDFFCRFNRIAPSSSHRKILLSFFQK